MMANESKERKKKDEKNEQEREKENLKRDLIGFEIELKIDCKRAIDVLLMMHSIFNEI